MTNDKIENLSKDEVIETIRYGKRDYNLMHWKNWVGENRTPICYPTVETNKRSYGPYSTTSHLCCVCRSHYLVKVPKNKNFNDWFNAEHVLWSEPATVSEDAIVAIAGFQSEVCDDCE